MQTDPARAARRRRGDRCGSLRRSGCAPVYLVWALGAGRRGRAPDRRSPISAASTPETHGMGSCSCQAVQRSFTICSAKVTPRRGSATAWGWSGFHCRCRDSPEYVASYQARRSPTVTNTNRCVTARSCSIESKRRMTRPSLLSKPPSVRPSAISPGPDGRSGSRLRAATTHVPFSPLCGARSSTSPPLLGTSPPCRGRIGRSPLLARDAGVPHRIIKRRDFNEDHLRAFDQHTGLQTADLDRELIPWGQYAQLPGNAIVLLGNVFSLGALYFYTKLPAHPDSVAESVGPAYWLCQTSPRLAGPLPRHPRVGRLD